MLNKKRMATTSFTMMELRMIVMFMVVADSVAHAKTDFIFEHDFIMAMYLADRVIVYHLQPGIGVTASKPQSLLSCMNQFLKSLEVTFRRDLVNFRRR